MISELYGKTILSFVNNCQIVFQMKVKVTQSCPTLQTHGLYSSWNSPDQNTRVGSYSLLQGIFPTQGSNPGLGHCRVAQLVKNLPAAQENPC